MPDLHCSFLDDRVWELQQIFSSSQHGDQGGRDMKKERFNSKKLLKSSVAQGGGHVHRNTSLRGQSAALKKARGKESSKYFGVRFRPDLHKWVAEIRVAEWKSVDKKAWLGTFDTEVGAARAVDAARKLLKCEKKRLPNFPCLNLDAYALTIPAHLNLNDLGNDAMFKEVTLFVKHKAQAYAASFDGPSPANDACASVVAPHPAGATTSSSFYPQPPLRMQCECSSRSQSSFVSSCDEGSSLLLYQDCSALPCQGLPMMSSSSSSNPEDRRELHWAQLHESVCSSLDPRGPFCEDADMVDDQSMVGSETMDAKSQLSWEELKFSFLNDVREDDVQDDVGDLELLLDNVWSDYEYCIPSNNQAYCDYNLTSMDVSHDELPCNNFLTKHDMHFQQTDFIVTDTNMLHPFNNSVLLNHVDCLQVY